MQSFKTAGAVLFAIALGLSLPAVGHADAPAGGAVSPEAREALRMTVRALDLQTRLPDETTKVEPENYKPPQNPLPRRLLSAETAQVMLWMAIAGIVVVILWHLRDNLWSASRARKLTQAEEEEIAPVATVARMEKAQLEADDLARQGDFAEAMHMLLLQSLSEMRRRLDVSIAVSLTSREILRAIGLPPRGREALGDIIGRVEVSYFGSYRPSAEEYSACRASYEVLKETLHRGGGN